MPASATVPVTVDFTPWENRNRDGRKIVVNRGGLRITIHDTDNKRPGTDAPWHGRWQDSTVVGGGADCRTINSPCVSVHFYVDDKSIVQKLPLDEIGYHAGDGCNDVVSDVGCFRSLSIEMCVNSEADHLQVGKNCAQLVVRIVLGDDQFDWGTGATRNLFSIDRLDQHIWVSQQIPPHDCPHSLRHADYGTTWEAWLAMVDEEFAARTSGQRPPAREYANPSPVAFIKNQPWVASGNVDGTTWALVERWYVTIKETPVLQHATRSSRSIRRPLDPGEKAHVIYLGISEGEEWGLSPFYSRIPLKAMVADAGQNLGIANRYDGKLTRAGGQWSTLDDLNDDLKEAAGQTGVPSNLIKSMLAREGAFGTDRRIADVGRKKPDGSINHIYAFNGIFETTAASRGIDWQRMVTDIGYAVFAMAEVLRQIHRDHDFGWDDVAGYYFAGPNWNNPNWGDETGVNTVRNYKYGPTGVITRWHQLDELAG